METEKITEKLIQYAKNEKRWDEIVIERTGNYKCSIKSTGHVVILYGDGNVTWKCTKYNIDSIKEPLCGLSILERKLEVIHYLFYNEKYKPMR